MASADIIARATTRMTRVRIEQQDHHRHLKFEHDTDAIQSSINMDAPQQLIMENLQFLLGLLLFIQRPQRILLLGVGGGSIIHYVRHHLPDAHITGVEYDAELLEFAQQHLALPVADERLVYYIEDARRFVEQDPLFYDLVLVDIFNGDASPPWLLQKPMTELLQQRLSPIGAIGYNLLIKTDKGFKRFYQMLRGQYRQQTLCLETEDYANQLVYALNFSAPALSMEQLIDRWTEIEDEHELPFKDILASIFSINPQGSGII